MAASSPAKSNSAAMDAIAAAVPSVPNPSKGLRGLNKPKCIKCGNVARSRCPYQSCKNCCAKAQNPCHIHVLKGNSSLPDKPPASSSPQFDHQSTEVSHSGSFHRLRQLSSSFSQFSNLQTPLRSRRPLTKKDAQAINEWRFLKLKEFKDGNIAAETEAFDRYIQNVGLLEEVFLVNSTTDDDSFVDGENTEMSAKVLKLKLGSNPVRSDSLRKRIQRIVDQGIMKLGKAEDLVDGTASDIITERVAKKFKCVEGEVAVSLSDLNDKLNKARSEDDLKACWEMASETFRWKNKKGSEEVFDSQKDPKCDSSTRQQSYRRWVTPSTLDHEALCRVDAQFCSLEEIEDL